MKLVKKKYIYLIDNFFPKSIIAGFTDTTLEGRDVVGDLTKVLEELRINAGIAFMDQTHSSLVNFVDRGGKYRADAIFTIQKEVVLVVKTADCLPLLFYEEKKGYIGVIHLGWRSAKLGILNNINMDFSKGKVLAGVGLRKCCFRTGAEFINYKELEQFLEKRESLYFDPISFSLHSFLYKGVDRDNFVDLNICSFCNSLNFFSFRREKTEKRTLSFIVKLDS
ncbi:MAG: polyphenol oxidase family protein [Candidatus Omnitrophica bacterium]|nr:polyphenol oxidase family protein [Candidatus Omnitrophota bacterium]